MYTLRIKTMLAKIQKYIADGEQIKQAFVTYIKDKSIPLEERWKTFGAAPFEFKNQDSSVVYFKVENTLSEGEIVWYDDFNIEKYETVEMFQFINRQIEDLASPYRDKNKEQFTLEFFTAFKEEVLDKNMHSFKFNW